MTENPNDLRLVHLYHSYVPDIQSTGQPPLMRTRKVVRESEF